jgi:ATP-dependent exoDNAse (exonuclease V) alpha subunit
MMNPEDLLNETVETRSPHVVSCEFLTGIAGSGKTFECKSRILKDETYGILCATTGIAAVNLGEGVTTINALLRYFDTNSLEDSVRSGRLRRRLTELAFKEGYRNIVLDEVSMLDARQLDLIYSGVQEVNSFGHHLGILLTGDFCQLPPVKAEGFAFEASCWDKFEARTTKLTKCWRHEDPGFLDALNKFRAGRGTPGISLLKQTDAVMSGTLDNDFDGSTVMAKNIDVNDFNQMRLDKLPGKAFGLKTVRWCAPGRTEVLKQWEQIPPESTYKPGALVMVLANSTGDTDQYRYVNGDLAHVIEFNRDTKELTVELLRTGTRIGIPAIWRRHEQKMIPPNFEAIPSEKWPKNRTESQQQNSKDLTYFDKSKKRWVVGECLYYPVRLAWATTVFKSQGLTLEKIQIDLRNDFFGFPAMAYVALSRCKTAGGLHLVGSWNLLAGRCRADPKCERFQ